MEKTKEIPKKYICSNPNILPSCSNRKSNRCHFQRECHLKESIPTYIQIIDTVGGEEKFCELAGIKPNQKQYKEFSPELFKAYIDKFNDNDKRKACSILNSIVSWL